MNDIEYIKVKNKNTVNPILKKDGKLLHNKRIRKQGGNHYQRVYRELGR